MQIKKGDFILVNYITKIKETGNIFDTTIQEEAKIGGIFKEDAIYEPMLIVVGERWVLEELDRSLIGLEIGKANIIEIPPKKGFGLRDPNKIRLVSIRRFKDKKSNLYPGAQVELNGKLALVRSVGSGRVQLDFNPPLAGKTLVYDLIVKTKIKDKKEKIKALIHRRIPPIDIAKIKMVIKKKTILIELPQEASFLEGIQIAKKGIASDIHKLFQRFDKITFIESFTRPDSIDVKSQELEDVQDDIELDK